MLFHCNGEQFCFLRETRKGKAPGKEKQQGCGDNRKDNFIQVKIFYKLKIIRRMPILILLKFICKMDIFGIKKVDILRKANE